jgi:hypothetical protein
MLRVTLLTILMLLGISGTIIYTQWNDYQLASSEAKNMALVHDIMIRNNGKQLEIRHRLSGVNEENYEITIPKTIKNLSCETEANKKCFFYNKNGKSFMKTNGLTSIQLKYVVSLPTKTDAIWLKDWSVSFLSKQKQQFRVELIDLTQKDGVWMAGAQLEGQIRRDDFMFYSWSQTDVLSFPLYFQTMKLERMDYGTMEIYTRKESNVKEWEETIAGKISNVPSLTIVVTPFQRKHISPTLIVIPEKESLTSIEADYIRSYYRSLFHPNSQVEDWVWDLLAAIILNKDASIPKAKEVLKEFNNQLTKEEKKAFLEEILAQKEKELTFKMLDDALSKAHGGFTTYFSDNGTKRGYTPALLFSENDTLFVNGEQLKEVYAVTRNRERLLPFVEIMTKLGYKVKKSGEAVFIDKGYNSWRFFVNSTIYMESNDRYGTSSVIIHEINGKLYISEKMIQDWFYVEIEQRDNQIFINEQ